MKTTTSKPRYFVGIDPGVNTGFAVWDRKEQRFTDIATLQLHEAIIMVFDMYKKGEIFDTFFVVEDARKRKGDAGLTPEKAQGAGSVKRDSKIWEEFLTAIGAHFQMRKPSGALNKIAHDKKMFELNTGHTGRTSKHARCAAMLVWKA